MDYKKFEKAIGSYIIEYDNNNDKSAKKIENVEKNLNIKGNKIVGLIILFENIINKEVYKYYYNKITSIGKSIYAKDEKTSDDDKVRTCISNKYNNITIENLNSLSNNTFSTKINGKNKIVNFSHNDNYSIEYNYRDLKKKQYIFKILAKNKIIPKIHDIVLCRENLNKKRGKNVILADALYHIIIYDNPSDYRKLNSENIKKISIDDKKKLHDNIKIFSQKIIDSKIISLDIFVRDNAEGFINSIYFDNNFNIVLIISNNFYLYNFKDKDETIINKEVVYKKITGELFKKNNKIQYLYLKKYIMLRLLQDKILII